ncbi:MAG: dethiobiotin synthase [Firmicutes bacterium]|nr:dethiobiotin synthase [Bacillota bacterium]
MNKNTYQQKMIFITGTDTNVGKTIVTGGLLLAFRSRGYRTLAMKPFQTGTYLQDGRRISPDGLFYGTQEEPPEIVNPVAMEPPAAPWAATLLTGEEVVTSRAFQAIAEARPRYDLLLLEGAGGLCVPLKQDFLVADLIRELGCPILIVARGSLGTINHTLLTVHYARAQGIPILGVIINGLTQGEDPVADLNPRIIKELSGVPLFGVIPYSSGISMEELKTGDLAELMERFVDLAALEGDIFGQS